MGCRTPISLMDPMSSLSSSGSKTVRGWRGFGTMSATLRYANVAPGTATSSTGSLARFPADALEPDALAEWASAAARSEEHTSELQSRPHLVCRLLLEKKK